MRVVNRRTFLAVALGLSLTPPVASLVHASGAQATRISASVNGAARTGAGAVSHRTMSHSRAAATLKVASGYAESFRSAAWVPVRVTAHNRTATTIDGTIEVPDESTTGGQNGVPQPYRALYQTPIVLPGHSTKHVTLYIPGNDISADVNVALRSGSHVYATASDAPGTWDPSTLSIGVVTSDPAHMAWIRNLNSDLAFSTSVVQLTPEIVDPLPEALANFDVIAIVDGSISGLDAGQLGALEQFVRNGGGLVEVGGPGWQETLRPLPSSLVPGTLGGIRTLPNLLGLRAIDPVSPPSHESAAVVSKLRNPRGVVLASEHGVPLAVQEALGSGQIVYLGFDPTLDPVAHWQGVQHILDRVLLRAAPAAAGHAGANTSSQGSIFSTNGPAGLTTELANVSAAATPSIVLFLILALLYILLLGPANFLVLRRLRRQELLWITVPIGSMLCIGATFTVASHLKGNAVLVNAVGMVTLTGTNGPQPADLYMGLFAPARGDYSLTYDGTALPQYVSDNFAGDQGARNPPLGLRFQEGSRTIVQFLDMTMWSMRDTALHTAVSIQGRVSSHLRIDRNGDIVGTIQNGTPLTLVHAVVVAGRGTGVLPTLPPGKTVSVRVRPRLNIYNQNNQSIWTQLYGQPRFTGIGYFSRGPGYFCAVTGCPRLVNFGPCCAVGPSPTPEHTFVDRARSAVSVMQETQNVTSAGEVLLIAWTEQPVARISVDGVSPQQRDLTVLVSPLSIGIQPGPFTLRTGTYGAHLVDISPAQGSGNGCCSTTGPDALDIGMGGSATFEFDLPSAHPLHFHHLTLNVDAGGADGTDMGRVWDWHARRWVMADLTFGYAHLTNPDRFVSPEGQMLVKLVDSENASLFGSSDVRIGDIHRNLQIYGDGVAG